MALELNRIYNMDCLEGMRQMEDKSVDLVLTDPPYGIEYLSNWYKDGNPFGKIENDGEFFCPTDLMWGKVKEGGGDVCVPFP